MIHYEAKPAAGGLSHDVLPDSVERGRGILVILNGDSWVQNNLFYNRSYLFLFAFSLYRGYLLVAPSIASFGGVSIYLKCL